ncbi:MAG: LysR family transcriptional regulator [Burkholderiaceae bacterium]
MSAKHLDLQLLAIFDAIMSERNVTRAADRLALSQPAVSKGLMQLREVFGDPLFLRSGRGVVPTHRALELTEEVRKAITALNGLLGPAPVFDPGSARAEFNIGATDYVSLVLLPGLMERLGKGASRVSIKVQMIEPLTPEEMLLTGKVDLALSTVTSTSFPLHREELFRDAYVCVCRDGHPLLSEGAAQDVLAARRVPTLAQFAASRHLAMPRQNGAREMILQDVMQRAGVSRDVAMQIPYLLAVPPVLLATDLIMTLASRAAAALAQQHPLCVLPHPLPLPEFPVFQIWHDRTHRSASHRWLRDEIAAAAARLPALPAAQPSER